MANWEAWCEECDEEFEFDTEEGALGWMFGHGFRTEHYDTKKEEV